MANYFSNRKNNISKKAALRAELENICMQEKIEHDDYIMRVQNIITSRPGMTASQYAMLLSDNACERNSIRTSIGNMGYVADYHRKFITGKCYAFEGDLTPTMPNLKRKEITIKRRFIEVDENNQPIGTVEREEYKHIYSIEE